MQMESVMLRSEQGCPGMLADADTVKIADDVFSFVACCICLENITEQS
jgi:hypothetical protein